MDGTSTVYFYHCVCGMPPCLYGGAEFCYALQRIWGDLEIYAGQLQKYSGTCIPEYICGITEAGIYQYDSDRFDRLSVRVFHGEAAGAQKEKGAASVVYAVLGKFPDPSVWLDHYSAEKGLLNFVLIKLGIIEKPLSILYSYPAIVIGMIYVLLPFMIMSVYSSAEKLDWSYVEAARDLGASRMQAFFTIILKLTLPGLLSGVILTFVPSMGLFFIADILGGNKVVLVGSLIQDQMTRGSNWPFAAALAVVMMVLTTVLIMIYRKVTNAGELEGIG